MRANNRNAFILAFITGLILISCKSMEFTTADEQKIEVRSIDDYFERSDALNSYHVGFGLYDMEEDQWVFEHNTKKFFTPASNTKLLTLYSALTHLSDSVAFINRLDNSEMQFYEPMGDPSFLHPELTTSERIQNFFTDRHEVGDTVFFHVSHFKNPKYGSGWAWDDYEYSYQAELSPFPIHSNYAIIHEDFAVHPSWLDLELEFKGNLSGVYERDPESNTVFYDNAPDRPWEVPFTDQKSVWASYFKSLGLEFEVIEERGGIGIYGIENYYSQPTDSLYHLLMQRSDNHVAEQLLLQVGYKLFGEMNTKKTIEGLLDTTFSEEREGLRWVDGSGLSRYNLFQPQMMVSVMNRLVEDFGLERVKSILPAGGEDAWLKNWYAFEDGPRVYAKTGTLRHNHCLTGLVQARSGKWYSFSFMNNNYKGSSSYSKTEMQNVLNLVVETY